MREFLYRLVQRLHDEARPLSRNRHFHTFVGEARRALRIDRHLRDLEQHLELLRARGERPRVRALRGGPAQLILPPPTLAVVRTATLSPEEVALIAKSPAGAWALGEVDAEAARTRAADQGESPPPKARRATPLERKAPSGAWSEPVQPQNSPTAE